MDPQYVTHSTGCTDHITYDLLSVASTHGTTMGRRKTTALEDIIDIGSVLPWWGSLTAAIGTWLLFQYLAQLEPATPTGIENMGGVMVRQLVISVSSIAKYMVPLLLLLGTAITLLKNLARSMTYDSVTGSRWFARRKGSRNLDSLSWRQFEEVVQEYFRRNGYAVAETVAGPDGGVDLQLRKDSMTATVQCKHWQKKKVDVRIVREQFGVMTAARADECFVVTSGKFTDEARNFAKGQPITLIDGRQLRDLLGSKIPDISQEHQSHREPAVVCPSCGSGMRLRTARRGLNSGSRFWGCSRFPNCRGTRQVV